jgi:hypothetical protein
LTHRIASSTQRAIAPHRTNMPTNNMSANAHFGASLTANRDATCQHDVNQTESLRHISLLVEFVLTNKSHEVKRMIGIQSSRGLPCHIIRLNPDPFKIGGVTANVSIETRYDALRDQVKLAFLNPPSSDLVVTYMYYDNDDSHIRTEIVDV